MKRTVVFGFEWGFLREVSWWALGIAVVTAIAGAFITHDSAFAAGCLVAGGIDVALVMSAARRAETELQRGRMDVAASTVMLAGRLIVKASLLVFALLVPHVLGFAGTVAGALVFDITLAFVGSVLAIIRGMHPREGGGEHA